MKTGVGFRPAPVLRGHYSICLSIAWSSKKVRRAFNPNYQTISNQRSIQIYLGEGETETRQKLWAPRSRWRQPSKERGRPRRGGPD